MTQLSNRFHSDTPDFATKAYNMELWIALEKELMMTVQIIHRTLVSRLDSIAGSAHPERHPYQSPSNSEDTRSVVSYNTMNHVWWADTGERIPNAGRFSGEALPAKPLNILSPPTVEMGVATLQHSRYRLKWIRKSCVEMLVTV